MTCINPSLSSERGEGFVPIKGIKSVGMSTEKNSDAILVLKLKMKTFINSMVCVFVCVCVCVCVVLYAVCA